MFDISTARKDFNKNAGYGFSHMVIITNLIDMSQTTIYVAKHGDVDQVLGCISAVDNLRIEGVLNYTLSFNLQLKQILCQNTKPDGTPKLTLIK